MGESVKFRNFSFDTMLPLDMLAEVASETLKNDPSLAFKSDLDEKQAPLNVNSKYSPKRSASNNEKLTLDQIRILSDKSLLEMFSESCSDEMKKIFSYKCYLVPDKCNESFSSFGNETKARLQMKSHLVSHISELISEANLPENDGKFIFEAEPVHVKKKKQLETGSKKRKKVKQLNKKEKFKFQKPVLDKKSKSKGIKTTINKKAKVVNKNNLFSTASMLNGMFTARLRKKMSQNISVVDKVEKENERYRALMEESFLPFRNVKSICDRNYISEEQKSYSNHLYNKKLKTDISDADIKLLKQGVEDMKKLNNDLSHRKEEVPNLDQKLNSVRSVWPNSAESIFTNCIKSESLVHTLHDHTYTSIKGKTFVEPNLKSGKVVDKVRKDIWKLPNKNVGVPLQFIISTPPFPYIYIPILPQVCEITEVGTKLSSANKQSRHGSPGGTIKTLHLFSHNLVEMTKSIHCNNFEHNDSCDMKVKSKDEVETSRKPELSHMNGEIKNSDDNSIIKNENEEAASEVKDSINADSTPGTERKLALKCIRQLRTKKKEERGPLICRICKDKSFTAQATLMYHYRSHAGIKPFSCSVCDATFTRQHSLNYHMLIHNNKSRFVCSDCGRNFRHPSHYKEHLRRHTGETPYQCTDCSLRFKTRNTYKRHLKTRHGKILTARGIRILSLEEFDKVRTSPRSAISKTILTLRVKDSEWQNTSNIQLQDETSDTHQN